MVTLIGSAKDHLIKAMQEHNGSILRIDFAGFG